MRELAGGPQGLAPTLKQMTAIALSLLVSPLVSPVPWGGERHHRRHRKEGARDSVPRSVCTPGGGPHTLFGSAAAPL